MPLLFKDGVLLYGPRDIENSIEHEIGHNLGIGEHGGDGAMKPFEPNAPNGQDVVNIIKNAFEGKVGNASFRISNSVEYDKEEQYDPNLRSKTVTLKEE
jgi:hypothetical protein